MPLVDDRVITALDQRLRRLESQEIWYQKYFKQYEYGDLYVSNNPDAMAADAFHLIDFWFDTRNRKFRTRAGIFADMNNRAQIIAGRYVGSDDYNIINQSVSAGDALGSLIGDGAIADAAGVGKPDRSTFGEITFLPDPAHGPYTTTSNPGIIVFSTVRPGQSGYGGNFACTHQAVMDSDGLWILGMAGSWSTFPDHSFYNARLNLRMDPGNTVFPALNGFHASDPTAGQTGQSIAWGFHLRGNSGAGNTWIEASRFQITKLADFTSLANQSVQMRISIIKAGVFEAILTCAPTFVEMHERVHMVAATTARASCTLPHGTAPTSPVDGDMWTTTAGLFVRINGVTVGPLT